MFNNFALETGIGYSPQSYRIVETGKGFEHLAKYNIDLHYASIPIGLSYTASISEKSVFVFSLEMSARYLLHYKDQIDQIKGVFSEIAWPKNHRRYSKLVLAERYSIAYQFKSSNTQIIEIGLFFGYDITPFVRNSYAYLVEALRPSRTIIYGIGIKYFLPHFQHK